MAAAPSIQPSGADDPSRPGQVSFVIQHTVRPGRRGAYEEWLHRAIAAAGKFPGHLGAQVARPAGTSDVYEISVRFATRADAERWANSDVRRRLVEELSAHIAEPERLDIKSGIDYWFTAATGGKPPPVWKQWLTTVSVIWPLSLVLPALLDALLYPVFPFLGRWGIAQLVTAMAMVGALTWIIMPPYTRAIRGWLGR